MIRSNKLSTLRVLDRLSTVQGHVRSRFTDAGPPVMTVDLPIPWTIIGPLKRAMPPTFNWKRHDQEESHYRQTPQGT